MRKNPPTFPVSKLTGQSNKNEKLVDDGDTHGTAGTGNLGLSSLQSSAVQVGHLDLSDLRNLSLGDGANLGLVGNTGTTLQTDCLHDQHGGRRSLGDEGEAAVSVNSVDNRDLVTFLILSKSVEFLDKCSDVNAVLTQSRANGGG